MAKEKTVSACSVEGCKRPHRAKSYCNYHYKKWRHGELAHSRYKTCMQENCRKKRRLLSSSFCEEHYQAKFGKKEAATVPVAAPTPAAEAAPA